VQKASSKVPKTPGNAFAGCSTRQRASGKNRPGKGVFVGSFLSGTDKSLCWEPGAISEAPDKEFRFFFLNFFASGQHHGKGFSNFFY
jgi:hypothetical protein